MALLRRERTTARPQETTLAAERRNSTPKAWIYVPEGYCERIVGGSKNPK
jgi:Predicted integral membrane protein (DUF2282)